MHVGICLDYVLQVLIYHAANAGFNNTYKSIRLISDTFNLYYSVWCTNEHELYDMSVRLMLVFGALHYIF